MSDVIPLGTETDPAKRLRVLWGKKVKQTRELRTLTRRQLADLLDVTEAAVGMWERGETSPRPHHQLAIAKTLDVPHGALFPMEAA